ncbi:MAG: ABC transporter substrate-binding protein [Hymenobacteraceae bacterium]|nr:ABC transporter substrate-binding protein [Hymenobacteraceae bacterium]
MPVVNLRSLLCALLLSAAACQSTPDQPAAAPPVAFHTVADDLGRAVRLPVRPRRVLALAPSMTEMLWAVAAPGQLVGRTQSCNYPAAALQLPVVNTYPLDLEALVKLRPDAVFTVEGMTTAGHIAQLEKLGIPVYQQAYDSVADIPRGLEDLGQLLGSGERGKFVADSLRRVVAVIHAAAPAALALTRAPGGGVLAITWADPIYVYGHPTLFTDALRLLGLKNAVPATIGQPFPVLPRETVLKLNPDLLIGGDFLALDTTLFRRYPELRTIAAYRYQQVYAIDDDLISRPSPRIGQLLDTLRALVNKAVAPAARPQMWPALSQRRR